MKLGVDIGGTSIKYGVIDENYNIVFKSSIETQADRIDRELVDDIIYVCKKTQNDYPIKSIGIGSPGRVIAESGILVNANNLPFKNTPIVNWIRQHIDLPVFIGNDANCATLGEFYAGGNKTIDNMVMITLGTGVGGGIILNKKLYLGKDKTAGEIGHMSINFEGLPCKCGKIGCFEKYASVTALISQTKVAIEQNPGCLMAKICCLKDITGKTAFEAAKLGCSVAAMVVEKYVRYLAIGINNVIVLLRPDVIVLAGGITYEDAYLLNPLKEIVNNKCDVTISKLKNDAGMIGAALLCKL